MSLDDEVRSITSTFSFVAVLISFFLTGFVFVLLVLPLLVGPWDNTQPLARLGDLLVELKTDWGVSFTKNSGEPLTLIYPLLIFVVGFSLQPLANICVWSAGEGFNLVWQVGRKVVGWIGKTKLSGIVAKIDFYKPIGGTKEYAEFIDKLHDDKNKGAKSAWQWEFFQYYLSSGIAFNVGCLSIVVLVRNLWCRTNTGWISTEVLMLPLILSLGFILAMFHACARSKILQGMYEHYRRG